MATRENIRPRHDLSLFDKCALCVLANCTQCLPELANEKRGQRVSKPDQQFISRVVAAADTQPYSAHK